MHGAFPYRQEDRGQEICRLADRSRLLFNQTYGTRGYLNAKYQLDVSAKYGQQL